ncbi:MAG TPA: fatty acid desaturase [Gemmataceae bacterium]|nr:fatty acid desaturase [Gemmataceae bacterium]
MAAGHRRKRLAWGTLLFAVDFATYLALLAGVCLLPGMWLKGTCAIAAGLIVGRLFGLAHDAAHDNLTPSSRLNRWIARLSFAPALTPLTSWVTDHHICHHAQLRVRGKDVTWPPLGLGEYRARSAWGRLWYRFLRTPPGMGFYWVFEYWWPILFFPRAEQLGRRRASFRRDRLLVCGFVVSLWVGMLALARSAEGLGWVEPVKPAGALALAVAIPFLVWATISGVIDYVTHTHPRAVWFADKSEWTYRDGVRNTPHVVFPFGLNRLMHNFFDHTAHHVDPRIPLYRLPAAQLELEAAFPGEAVIERFTLGYFLRLLRVCRLYDFERHCWLDYDGTPSTVPQPLAPGVGGGPPVG